MRRQSWKWRHMNRGSSPSNSRLDRRIQKIWEDIEVILAKSTSKEYETINLRFDNTMRWVKLKNDIIFGKLTHTNKFLVMWGTCNRLFRVNLTSEAKRDWKIVELVEIIGKPWPLLRKTCSLAEVGTSFIKFWGDAVTWWVAPESMYQFCDCWVGLALAK